MSKELIKSDWYNQLIEDCKSIITEGIFNSRWFLIETYHHLGRRIVEENDNFSRAKIYGEKIVQRVAESMGISERTIQYTLQFVKKYPNLSELPEGKNISWHKIVNNLLPSPQKEEKKVVCKHCPIHCT